MKGNRRSVDIFSSKDVVCGRGRALERHPGNMAFRRFIRQFSEEYSMANRGAKSMMLSYLLQHMKQRSVRIFKRYDDGRYKEVDDDALKDKIGHALRDSKNHPKGLPKKTKNVSKTISTSADDKFSGASTTLTFEKIFDDIQRSKTAMVKQKPQHAAKDSTSLRVGSESFTSDSTVDGGLEPCSVPLHDADDHVGTLVHSQIESLAIRKGVTNGSNARSHERHATVISRDDERMHPTHDFNNPSEPLPLSMNMGPSEPIAFELAMGSTWTLTNTHCSCDDQRRAWVADDDDTSHDGVVDWNVEGLTCTGVEAIFREFNADFDSFDTIDDNAKNDRPMLQLENL